MLDFLHRYMVLHLLLNLSYVGIGIVAGVLLAWKVGLERRFEVRRSFLLRLLLIAVALAGLITLLTSETGHLVFGSLAGIAAGFVAAYLSRAQAKPS